MGPGLSHFATRDAGKTWALIQKQAQVQSFLFHRTKPTWALLSYWSGTQGTRSHDLYLTTDLGKTFKKIQSNVVQFSWGDPLNKHDDRIYFTRFRQDTLRGRDQPKLTRWMDGIDFAYTDSLGRDSTVKVENGNKFQISHGYILVVKVKDAEHQSVELSVSADGGDSFEVARLPHRLKMFAFTLLDASEGALILHVNKMNNLGDIYVSDRRGLNFSLALPNNVRSGGLCGFEKVMNLRGIYIANVVADASASSSYAAGGQEEHVDVTEGATSMTQADSEVRIARSLSALDDEATARSLAEQKGGKPPIIRTVISFNKGGTWSYLTPPSGNKDCEPGKCWLNLHDFTEIKYFAPVYSYRNAVGILMASGNLGASLGRPGDKTKPTRTYMSRDGGLTWAEAHEGNYIYEYGNHGGLIVMADMTRPTNEIIFSWNEGHTWIAKNFTDTPMAVSNVIIEPDATSTKFIIYGARNKKGVLHLLDFSGIHQRLCRGQTTPNVDASDYETWTPSDGSSGSRHCIMGFSVEYTRRKQTAECFHASRWEHQTAPKPCPCVRESYECNTGFIRKLGSDVCAQEEVFHIPPWVQGQCAASDHYFVDAYRRVPDNMCQDGWKPSPVSLPCPNPHAVGAHAGSEGTSTGTKILHILMLFGVIGAALYVLRSDWVKDLLQQRHEHFGYYAGPRHPRSLSEARRIGQWRNTGDAEMRSYQPPATDNL